MKPLTHPEIVSRAAAKAKGKPNIARETVNAYIEEIVKELKAYGEASIINLGKFQLMEKQKDRRKYETEYYIRFTPKRRLINELNDL